jgi:hypothetical protein
VEEGRRNLVVRKVSRLEAPPGRSLADLAEAFLVSKQVAGVSGNTHSSHRMWLRHMVKGLGDNGPNPLAAQRYMASLRERGLIASSVHKAF